MQWSKYNYLFNSKKHGWLLYNSASNTFAHIEDDLYPEILKIQSNPKAYDFGQDLGLYFQLRENGILVEERGDDIFRNMLKMYRLQNNYDTSYLMLTIAPTRACNFDCVYCYEHDREPIFMSDETELAIIDFIKRYKNLTRLALSWYGGEPLLCFDRLCSLTTKIQALNIPFNAQLITNGYLLNEAIISKLPDLKIDTIQITIDGEETTHNQRRPLKNGGATFQTILRNLDALLPKWEGTLALRVNIDHTNQAGYHLTYQELKKRFEPFNTKGRIFIHPGIVHNNNANHPDISCLIDRDEEAVFTIEQYAQYGIKDLKAFPGRAYAGCIACRRNGFVIGPEGELYKCWDDIGIAERRVGAIQKGVTWNMALIADYMVGSTYLDDPECLTCFYLPVCDGGCPHMRVTNYLGQTEHNVCSKFKHYLEDLLEIYYEQKTTPADNAAMSDSKPLE
jgi:uncharacterized protein